VTVKGATVRFIFKGKCGREVDGGVTNPRIARVMKRCDELPGQHLFQNVDRGGERRNVTSDDVNQYLRQASGDNFSEGLPDVGRHRACDLRAARPVGIRVGDGGEAKRGRRHRRRSPQARAHSCHLSAVLRPPPSIETYLDGSSASALGAIETSTPTMLRADEAAALMLLKRAAGR